MVSQVLDQKHLSRFRYSKLPLNASSALGFNIFSTMKIYVYMFHTEHTKEYKSSARKKAGLYKFCRTHTHIHTYVLTDTKLLFSLLSQILLNLALDERLKLERTHDSRSYSFELVPKRLPTIYKKILIISLFSHPFE